jgi:hypothetical protein
MIPLPKAKDKRGSRPMPIQTPAALSQQLQEQRRTVDFDSFDIQVTELLRQLDEGQIWIAPAYQRQFRWGEDRCSELIESLLLGIPIPNMFMATNSDSTWEVVDGLQRLSATAKFAGDAALRKRLGLGNALVLQDLKKLDKYNGLAFADLPAHVQTHFRTRPLKVVTLNDKSDKVLRFDLFERLNTGGIALTKQEIRDCVFRGPFSDMLGELSQSKDFQKTVRLTSKQKKDGAAEECVLRFFAFHDKYAEFNHSVTEFLNDYMKKKTEPADPHLEGKKKLFAATFKELARVFPNGITRGRTTTPLNLFEGVAVGAALALKKADHLHVQRVQTWVVSPELRRFTSGATNDRKNVKGRIEFCRDRFLGRPYVPDAED